MLLDLSKAFDTFVHDVLLDKLHRRGRTRPQNTLSKTYLVFRQKLVVYGSNESSSQRNSTRCTARISF